MNKHHTGIVQSITPLSSDIFRVTVTLDNVPEIRAGQFVNVKVPGFTLRRPFGISHFDAKTVSFCFQVRGEGTRALAQVKVGSTLDLLLPLGNGFPSTHNTPSMTRGVPEAGCLKKIMLIGGGIGVFPLLPAAKDTYAFLGFRNKDSVVLEKDFRKVAKEVTIVTEGFVTDIAKKEFERIKPDAIFACGPHAMFKALKDFPCPVYISLEERMACGFGACICCTADTVRGKERVCCEGPVFLLSEVNI